MNFSASLYVQKYSYPLFAVPTVELIAWVSDPPNTDQCTVMLVLGKVTVLISV